MVPERITISGLLICLFFLGLIISAENAAASKLRKKTVTNLILEPGKSFRFKIKTNIPLHVSMWADEQKRMCDKDCLSVEILQKRNNWKMTTRNHLGGEFDPVDGRIVVTFTNIAEHVVTIREIYADQHICDSQACELLKKDGISYPFNYNEVDFTRKRIVMATLTSIDTSKDGSFSRYKGTTVFGTPFDVYAIWWFIEELPAPWKSSCPEWIEKYGNYDAKSGKAYSFHGSFMTRPITNIFTDVGCSGTKVKEKENRDW